MDDSGDPAATALNTPVKSSPAPKPPAPASTPAPGPPHDASAESMISEMHALQESIEAGVASVNAATSVRTLSCKCVCLPRVAFTARHDASLCGADEGNFIPAAVVRGRPEGSPAPLVVEEVVTLTEASVIIEAFDPAISLA